MPFIAENIEPEAIQKILHTIEANQIDLNQRTFAQKLSCSLGRANYITNALIEKGLIKAERFYQSDNKRKYRYLLTPKGISEKLRLTRELMERKHQEYEELRKQLEQTENQTNP